MVWRQFAAKLAAMLTAGALFAPVAMAQSDRKCADAEFDSHSVPLGETAPFIGASHKPGMYRVVAGPNCRIVTFYRVLPELPGKTPAELRKLRTEYRGKVAPPFFAARYVDDRKSASYAPRWTDETRCPALVPAIQKLEPILAPKLTGDSPYVGTFSGTSEQPVVRLWMSGEVYPQNNPGYTIDMTLDGGGDEAFGAWLSETFKALDACWSPDPPVIK